MIGYVVLGGAIGALIRFLTERWSVHRFGERIPYGTFIVNMMGSLVLGVVVGLHERDAISDGLLVLVGTGFCGSLTTFSGWVGQIHTRARHDGSRGVAAVYLATSLVIGVALAYLGYAFTS